MKKWQASLMLITVAMLWGAGFIATDESLKYLEPLQMQIFRFGIGAVILSLLFFKRLKNASKRAIIYGIILGFILFVAMSFQSFGLDNTTVPKNAFLTVTNVVWVPIILAFVLKIKPKAYLFYGTVVILIGFFFLLFDIDFLNLTTSFANLHQQMNINFGDFLSLVGGILFAVHIILCGRFVGKEDPITMLIFQLVISTIFSMVLSFIFEGPFSSMGTNNFINALPALLFMAIFSSIIAFGMQLTAQKYLQASTAAILCSLESLFAAIFAIIVGNVALTSSLIIAAIVITFGIIWAETGLKFQEKSELKVR